MRKVLPALLGLVASACVLGLRPDAPAPGSGAVVPVVLVVEGTALDPAAVADVAATLSARLGRPVRTAAEPTLDEATQRERLTEEYGRLPPGGWTGVRCVEGRTATHALRYDADAYYHLRLDRTDTTRAATDLERASVSGARRASATVLGGIGLAAAGSVREARLAGALTVTTFGQTAQSVRLPLRASAHEVDAIGKVALDPVPVVADAIAKLAPPPGAHWAATARRQLAAGCRLAALAVYDARLRSRPDSRDVVGLALGRTTPRPPRRQAAVAPSVVPPPVVPSQPDPRTTCHALCELHMVELCNNDRDLWSRHQQLWESTPCGQRRSEPFLRACYQRQWLSGTFDEACRVPCEGAPDGRARLLHLLQGSGCNRMTSL